MRRDAGAGRRAARPAGRAERADQCSERDRRHPWAVYFRYRDTDGELQDGRSEIFTDGQLAYTLRTFDDQDQLVYVEVQSGFILMGGGRVDFAATKSWFRSSTPELADRVDRPGGTELPRRPPTG